MRGEKTRADEWRSCLTEEQLFFLNAWNHTSAYTVADVILGKVRICKNPNCRNVFIAKTCRSMFCSRRCSIWAATKKYHAKPEAKLARKIRDHIRWINRDAGTIALQQFYRIGKEERLHNDPEYYAKVRQARREVKRRQNDKHRKIPYKPCPSRRIPDWAVKGQDVVDRGSVFLSGNMSDEQVMAARDFVFQKYAGEEREHPRVKTVFRK